MFIDESFSAISKEVTSNVYQVIIEKANSEIEPFVYGLKAYNYATIIGENTAGAMLFSNEFKLENELILEYICTKV